MISQLVKIKRAQLQDVDTVFTFIKALEKEDFDKKIFKRLYSINLKNKDNIYVIAWNQEPIGYLGCQSRGCYTMVNTLLRYTRCMLFRK